MDAAQIHTRAHNGHVSFVLPPEYAALNNAQLLVMVVPEPKEDIADTSAELEVQARKERLVAAFDKLRQANPFRAIADPVQWQRELRDEWERTLPNRS